MLGIVLIAGGVKVILRHQPFFDIKYPLYERKEASKA